MFGTKHIDLTLADASATWRLESVNLRHTHPSYPYRHTPQAAAVVRYVALAYGFANRPRDLPTKPTQAEIARLGHGFALTVLLEGEVEPVADLARAIFLYHQHGIPVEKAMAHSAEELGLQTNVRKAGNNIAAGVRRLHLFFRSLFNPGSQPAVGSKWPAFPADG